jgi:hypothetical protein
MFVVGFLAFGYITFPCAVLIGLAVYLRSRGVPPSDIQAQNQAARGPQQ